MTDAAARARRLAKRAANPMLAALDAAVAAVAEAATKKATTLTEAELTALIERIKAQKIAAAKAAQGETNESARVATD